MSRDASVNNKISNNLRELLNEWVKTRGGTIADAVSAGLVLYMSVDNVLRSAAIAVDAQVQAMEAPPAHLRDMLIRARAEIEAEGEQTAGKLLSMPPPKRDGRQKTAG